MTNQVFTPEPCAHCDGPAITHCPTHGDVPAWDDSWLHPTERKHAPRIERN